jgi:hypothetical protein
MRPLGSLLFAVLFYHVASPAQVAGQASACVTNPDTAATHVETVTRIVEYDSSLLVSQGLPYRPPEGVVVVTDSLICRRVVDAYNALDSLATQRHITRAYVMRVGTTAYAMTFDGAVMYFVDTSYHWLAAMAALN